MDTPSLVAAGVSEHLVPSVERVAQSCYGCALLAASLHRKRMWFTAMKRVGHLGLHGCLETLDLGRYRGPVFSDSDKHTRPAEKETKSQPTQQTKPATKQWRKQPTQQAAKHPTNQPTDRPTNRPAGKPTNQPTDRPTEQPSGQPTNQPRQAQ